MKTKNNLQKLILALLLMVAASTVTYAQCDKTATLTSSTTSYIDNDGKVIKSKAEKAIITITKTDITIVPGDEEHKMTGAITSKICDWKIPYKEGKLVVKSTVSGDGGDEKHITVTIEGKDGKVTLTFEAEEMTDKKIWLVADKFE
ncbi:hypothetical protein [Mucilaginibacter sp.]|jgi:hypothetical protein|uniref:hypothetical protein n=1 Tax=Mucilaginibacter sp. TaxID=1882438 RepID=UPI0035693C4B